MWTNRRPGTEPNASSPGPTPLPRDIGPSALLVSCNDAIDREFASQQWTSEIRERFQEASELRTTASPGRRRASPGDVGGTSLGRGRSGACGNRSMGPWCDPGLRSRETTRSRVGATGAPRPADEGPPARAPRGSFETGPPWPGRLAARAGQRGFRDIMRDDSGSGKECRRAGRGTGPPQARTTRPSGSGTPRVAPRVSTTIGECSTIQGHR